MNREEAREAAKVMLAYADGEDLEWVRSDGRWVEENDDPNFDWSLNEWRIKPRKPSINWEHASEELKWLVRGPQDKCILSELEPYATDTHWTSPEPCVTVNASVFTSLDPGNCNWKDSKVRRPE